MEATTTGGDAGESTHASDLITVAIPTRNRAQLVRRAIESALAQTHTNIEVFVLDDSSTDDTPTVVSSYADAGVVHIRNEPALGMAGNWNSAFQIGSGEAVAILHDDDYWSPRFLERVSAMYFKNRPRPGFIYSQWVPTDLDGNVLRGPILSVPPTDTVMTSTEALERLIRSNEPGWPCLLWDRKAVTEVGGFVPDFPYHLDWQLWLRLAAKYPVGFVAETLGTWVQQEDQFSAEFEGISIGEDRFHMLRSTIPDLPLPPERRAELLGTAMRYLAETQLVDAWDFALKGRHKLARQNARFAFQIDPMIAARSPHLVAAAYTGSVLPAPVLGLLNQLRPRLRRVFRSS